MTKTNSGRWFLKGICRLGEEVASPEEFDRLKRDGKIVLVTGGRFYGYYWIEKENPADGASEGGDDWGETVP